MPTVEQNSKKPVRVVILGGGFAGAYCSRRFEAIDPDGFDVTVIDRNNYLLFYPLLVEAGTGNLEPRHATVPLRIMLPDGVYRMGEVLEVDTANARIRYRVAGDGPVEDITYDHLVLALGSVTSMPPIPGLAEHSFKMKSLGDAVSLRDRMLHLLEKANATTDVEERRRLLHVVVIGGSFTGVEVAGEYAALLKNSAPLYPNVDPKEIRVTLVEMAGRILSALEPELADYAAKSMGAHGIEFKLNESITKIAEDHALLKSGSRLDTRTVIWCAGIAPHPLLKKSTLPMDPRGWILCDDDGRVKGFKNVWGIGDCAVNLDENGVAYPPTAQAAIAEGAFVAQNIRHVERGEPTELIRFKNKGTVVPLGGHNGVVQLGSRYHFQGFPAWIVYRLFYLSRIPGLARKARVALDWVGAMFTEGDAVQLGIHARRNETPVKPSESPAGSAPSPR